MVQRVVCAACKFEDGTIILGIRHWDVFMTKQAKALGFRGMAEHEQGFVDQRGNFLSRKEALEVVRSTGQYFDPQRNSHHNTAAKCVELYSEGIY